MGERSRFFGIICEFNPLHLGHCYLIDKAKENGADYITCVMSGNFVQRGEPAIFSKWSRARAAIKCGADLVIELPTPFSMAGAEKFALGGVSVLESMKCIDTIIFGTEEEDLSLLYKAAQFFKSSEYHDEISREIKNGISFSAARSNVISAKLGKEYEEIIRSPNNILAVEYLKALLSLDSHITPCAIKRAGSMHDSSDETGFSASAIRKAIYSGRLPQNCFSNEAYEVFRKEIEEENAPADIKNIERAILSFLRISSPEDIKDTDDISEGLENKIISCARQASSLEELYGLIKSKRYSHARIRRIVLSSFLRISKYDGLPPYIKVLAMNEKGMEILKQVKERSPVPIITRRSDTENLDAKSLGLYNEECKATDIYSLCLPKIRPAGDEQRNSVIIVK